jgi:hypothetical protein
LRLETTDFGLKDLKSTLDLLPEQAHLKLYPLLHFILDRLVMAGTSGGGTTVPTARSSNIVGITGSSTSTSNITTVLATLATALSAMRKQPLLQNFAPPLC